MLRRITWYTYFSLSLLLLGCNSSDDCLVFVLDPSGHWIGTLTQQESDCPPNLTAGLNINAVHDVSTVCATNNVDNEERLVILEDQDKFYYDEQSYSALNGGTFVVEDEETNTFIENRTITYHNFDDSPADVQLKIRIYNRDTDRIICSELYRGQMRRAQ